MFDREVRLPEIPLRDHQAIVQKIPGERDPHRFVEYAGKVGSGKTCVFSRLGQGDRFPIPRVNVKDRSPDRLAGNVSATGRSSLAAAQQQDAKVFDVAPQKHFRQVVLLLFRKSPVDRPGQADAAAPIRFAQVCAQNAFRAAKDVLHLLCEKFRHKNDIVVADMLAGACLLPMVIL